MSIYSQTPEYSENRNEQQTLNCFVSAVGPLVGSSVGSLDGIVDGLIVGCPVGSLDGVGLIIRKYIGFNHQRH